jgi:hypothetical protein
MGDSTERIRTATESGFSENRANIMEYPVQVAECKHDLMYSLNLLKNLVWLHSQPLSDYKS